MMIDQVALVAAVEQVWEIPPPGPQNLLADPRFLAVAEILSQHSGTGKVALALSNALRNLGLPCARGQAGGPEPEQPAVVAEALAQGFRATTTQRRHLCPLDLADDLPPMVFGGARIDRFDKDQLEALIDRRRLDRCYPSRSVDFARLAQLQWLVVEEEVSIDPRPEARAVPILFQRMDQDFGAVDPLARRFPAAVEGTLFCLLLAPWETWATMLEVDWRGFRFPWIYTVDADLAVQPAAPPDADALGFEPVFHEDAYGDEHESERPVVLTLDDGVAQDLSAGMVDVWAKRQRAAGSDLFFTPVEHFMVRAFQSAGVDELLAHMTVLEAALGEEADHDKRLRPKPERTLSATERMARKVAWLLGDPTAADAYRDLFRIRSLFVHGRAGLGTISTDQRVMARQLARRVANMLLDLAAAGSPPRAAVLAQLLARGAP